MLEQESKGTDFTERRETALLRHASNEIKSLRKANYDMSLRLRMFDQCMELFGASRNTNGLCSMGEDISYSIDRHLGEAEAKERIGSSIPEGSLRPDPSDQIR